MENLKDSIEKCAENAKATLLHILEEEIRTKGNNSFVQEKIKKIITTIELILQEEKQNVKSRVDLRFRNVKKNILDLCNELRKGTPDLKNLSYNELDEFHEELLVEVEPIRAKASFERTLVEFDDLVDLCKRLKTLSVVIARDYSEDNSLILQQQYDEFKAFFDNNREELSLKEDVENLNLEMASIKEKLELGQIGKEEATRLKDELQRVDLQMFQANDRLMQIAEEKKPIRNRGRGRGRGRGGGVLDTSRAPGEGILDTSRLGRGRGRGRGH